MMTFLRLNNENKSAFFSLGEPVEALVDTDWICTIYKGHVDLVVTLLGTEKNMQSQNLIFAWHCGLLQSEGTSMSWKLHCCSQLMKSSLSPAFLIYLISQKEHKLHLFIVFYEESQWENRREFSMGETAMNSVPPKWLQQHWEQNGACLCMQLQTKRLQSQIKRDRTQMRKPSLRELPMLCGQMVTSTCIQTSGDL